MRLIVGIVLLPLLVFVPAHAHAIACKSTCSAPGVRSRTFVWVENVCGEVDGSVTLSQKLVARRGNCDPVTLLALPFKSRQLGGQQFAASCTASCVTRMAACRAEWGLREITHARGFVTDTPDVVEVELPGPFAYQ